MMTRIIVTLAALAGLLVPLGAIAAPSDQSTAQFQADAPLIIAKLQNQLMVQQAEISALQTAQGQDPNDPKVFFSAAAPPNPDGSPIPSGG